MNPIDGKNTCRIFTHPYVRSLIRAVNSDIISTISPSTIKNELST